MDIGQRNVQIAAVLSGLRESHVIFSGLVFEMSGEQLHMRRGEDCWTIGEHAAHLAEVQPMLAERIRRILNEENPEFIPFIPAEDESKEQPVPEMMDVLRSFKKGRDEIIRLLSEAAPEDWDRSAVHPEYNRYGLFILARHILMHDHWHMYRMEELWLTREAYLTKLEG